MTHRNCFCSSGVGNFSGNLPPGYRFSPTDEELFHHYLIPKRLGHPIDRMGEIDLYRYNPWDIPGIDPTKKKLCDQVWYFFCIREYRNNDTFMRKAGGGFWKSTGVPRSVTAEGSDEKIGTVRILVFCDPNATQWVMHEFEHDSHVKDNYVLCRIRLQPNKKKNKRARKSEQLSKTPKAKKKARKDKSNCSRASASITASENQNLTDIMPSSNYHKGAASATATATYGNGESSNPDAYYSFKNQIDEGGRRCSGASDLENYNPSGMDEIIKMSSNEKVKPTGACSENQNSYPMNFGKENQNSMSVDSPNNKVETSDPMNLDNGNQKNKMTHQSFCPVTSGNESLCQEVDNPIISHRGPLSIANSEEETLQEEQTDESITIRMPPNGGEAMSPQELVEADREAYKLLLELLFSAPDEQLISDEGKPK